MAWNKDLAEIKVIQARAISRKAKHVSKTLYEVLSDLRRRSGEIVIRSELLACYRKEYVDTMMEACELWIKTEEVDKMERIKSLTEEITELSIEFDELIVAVSQVNVEDSIASLKAGSPITCGQLSTCEEVGQWFDHLERIMSACGVTTEEMKFSVLTSLLDEDESLIIEPVVQSQGAARYSSAKAALKERLQATILQRLDEFFSYQQTNDGEKAIDIWNKLDKLVRPFCRQDIISWRILRCFPPAVGVEALLRDNSLKSPETLARRIDQILEDKSIDLATQKRPSERTSPGFSGGSENSGNGLINIHSARTASMTELPVEVVTSVAFEESERISQSKVPKSEMLVGKEEMTQADLETKLPDIQYSEGQWSPYNPNGKRQYDGEFLLQFQFRPSSLKKPKDLLDVDIVLQEPHCEVTNPNLLRELAEMSSVCSILDGINCSNFDTEIAKILSLHIDTESKLKGLVDALHERAVNEPCLSELYAKIFRRLCVIKVTPSEHTFSDEISDALPEKIVFRKMFLTKCMEELGKSFSDLELSLELKKEIEENEDLELLPQLKEEYQLVKRQQTCGLANVRFLGELFKLKLLAESVILETVIEPLLKARDDDYLEALCQLLTRIGNDLDRPKHKERMDRYFDQISAIINETQTSPKAQSLLEDIRVLRSNYWVRNSVTTKRALKSSNTIQQDDKQKTLEPIPTTAFFCEEEKKEIEPETQRSGLVKSPIERSYTRFLLERGAVVNSFPQYQYLQDPNKTQKRLYSPPNYPQYQQLAPKQEPLLPPQVQQMMMQQPPTSQKREKRIIRIIDPNTNQDVTEYFIKCSGSRQDSLSTAPSGQSSAIPLQDDEVVKFAAQVATISGTSKVALDLHHSEAFPGSPVMLGDNTSKQSEGFERTDGLPVGKSKTTSDIKYEDDQWSPINPEGKRRYDSSFLLQFQYKPSSLEKPKDLPDIDIVLNRPHSQVWTPIQAFSTADFTPPYMRAQMQRTGKQSSREHYSNRIGT